MCSMGAMTQNEWVLVSIVPFVLVCLVVAVVLARRTTGPAAALAAWAREHGLEILEANRRYFFRGSFRLPRSAGQSIYRIRVRDEDGGERSGIARVGGFFGLGKEVRVVWDRSQP